VGKAWHFRVSLKEWKTWVGIALVGIGSSLFMLPIQGWINDHLNVIFSAPWQIMLAGGIIAVGAMYFFKVT
jgi:hypothetical protein